MKNDDIVQCLSEIKTDIALINEKLDGRYITKEELNKRVNKWFYYMLTFIVIQGSALGWILTHYK